MNFAIRSCHGMQGGNKSHGDLWIKLDSAGQLVDAVGSGMLVVLGPAENLNSLFPNSFAII